MDSKLKFRCIGFAISFAAFALPASASPICEALTRPSDLQKPLANLGPGVECEATESDLQVCIWTFNLGSETSRTMLNLLHDRIAACPDVVGIIHDVGVNHPDYYDAWQFNFDGYRVVLSLEDKSSLSASLVTLRLRQ